MPAYTAPLRDYLYSLYDVLGFEHHAQMPGFDGLSRDVVEAVLEQAGRFAADVLHPLNRPADEEGARFEAGAVTTPRGFREAYALLCEGGWPGLTCAAEHGGQDMPHMLNVLFEEMINAACLAFGLFPGLTRGAYVALARHGSPDQKALYLPKLASGEWAGSMCLTEAHCGTDLGLLRTMAVPQADGRFAITGTKIFISAGEHDLTPNIIYLVLARLPGATPGTKGISLFLVPKFLSDTEGNLGARNAVACGSIEQKMGLHGCPTCVMHFDGATGWLVGEPHKGLKAMFSMMNTERLAVGIHGLAVAEASAQNAVAYARERLQGRSPAGPAAPDKPADPIIVHPDVRRMLLRQRALVEGGRMLALWVAQALDVSERHPDPAARQEADHFTALMTPVAKAFLTDMGSEAADIGLQVLGGHGYVRANGQEQLLRDVRVARIYEGTNGVQAMDLLGRKVMQMDLLPAFTRPVAAFCAAHEAEDGLAFCIVPLRAGLARLENATAAIRDRLPDDPHEMGANAVDYLRLLALVALAYLWARAAAVSLEQSDNPFHRAKLASAGYFMARLLPETMGLHAAIMAGAGPVMARDQASF